MITSMFSIFDSKAAAYGTPFFVPREAAAIRAFSDLANNKESSVGLHPEDYTLYHIGDFDDELATFKAVTPRPLVVGAALVKPSFNSSVVPNGLLSEVK